MVETGPSDLLQKTATIGEKLSVRRFAKVTGDVVTSLYPWWRKNRCFNVAAYGAEDDAAKSKLS